MQEVDSKIRVLVVDDDAGTRDLIADYLGDGVYATRAAGTAEEALRLLEHEAFRLAIIDIHLPGMSGTELLEELHRYRPEMLVIMITGYGTIRDAVQCMKLGASDFITKPILCDHLHLAIERSLEEARLKEEAELAAYYRNLSRTDELTGLFNFRHMTSTLKNEVERHLRYTHVMTLALIDIDDFKNYNDTRGHEEGNELLMRLAHIFRHNTRNCDILSRYGGEEFVIIFPETDIEEASVVTERICETVERTLGVTVTIGLASLPADTSDSHHLIRLADRAMYWGKRHGKNRIVVYEAAICTCR